MLLYVRNICVATHLRWSIVMNVINSAAVTEKSWENREPLVQSEHEPWIQAFMNRSRVWWRSFLFVFFFFCVPLDTLHVYIHTYMHINLSHLCHSLNTVIRNLSHFTFTFTLTSQINLSQPVAWPLIKAKHRNYKSHTHCHTHWAYIATHIGLRLWRPHRISLTTSRFCTTFIAPFTCRVLCFGSNEDWQGHEKRERVIFITHHKQCTTTCDFSLAS